MEPRSSLSCSQVPGKLKVLGKIS